MKIFSKLTAISFIAASALLTGNLSAYCPRCVAIEQQRAMQGSNGNQYADDYIEHGPGYTSPMRNFSNERMNSNQPMTYRQDSYGTEQKSNLPSGPNQVMTPPPVNQNSSMMQRQDNYGAEQRRGVNQQNPSVVPGQPAVSPAERPAQPQKLGYNYSQTPENYFSVATNEEEGKPTTPSTNKPSPNSSKNLPTPQIVYYNPSQNESSYIGAVTSIDSSTHERSAMRSHTNQNPNQNFNQHANPTYGNSDFYRGTPSSRERRTGYWNEGSMTDQSSVNPNYSNESYGTNGTNPSFNSQNNRAYPSQNQAGDFRY